MRVILSAGEEVNRGLCCRVEDNRVKRHNNRLQRTALCAAAEPER